MTFEELLTFMTSYPNHHAMVDEWSMEKMDDDDSDDSDDDHDDDDYHHHHHHRHHNEEWLEKHVDKQVDEMKKCVKLMEGNVFWIVLSRRIIKETWYEGFMDEAKKMFRFPELKYTFRNTKEIIEEVRLSMMNKDEHPELPPSRFPSYVKPVKLKINYWDLENEIKVNEILHKVKLNVTEHQINTTGVLIITGAGVNEKQLKCLLKCVKYSFKDSYACFAHYDHEDLSFNKIKDFIANGKGVCVCDYLAVKGFEAPIVVVYGDDGSVGNYNDYNTHANHNLYLRAIQKRIAINIE